MSVRSPQIDRAIKLLGPRAVPNRPLGPLTTYRVGGEAEIFVTAQSLGDLAAVHLALAETGLPVLVLGRGSNLLVADTGFPGIALTLGSGYDMVDTLLGSRRSDTERGRPEDIDREARDVKAGGATYLPVLARRCAGAGIGGLEWAVGIPGSVGGGVCMNAGGHGADIASVIVHAEIYDLGEGKLLEMTPATLGLGYRRSALSATQVVLSAEMAGYSADPASSRSRIDEIVRWRRAHQPGGANAGSVFVNPVGDTAGRLVEAAGLKGLRVGSAEVSSRHANFIQASRGGSADDVAILIDEIRRRVADSTGVDLEVECRLIGNFVSSSSRR